MSELLEWELCSKRSTPNTKSSRVERPEDPGCGRENQWLKLHGSEGHYESEYKKVKRY